MASEDIKKIEGVKRLLTAQNILEALKLGSQTIEELAESLTTTEAHVSAYLRDLMSLGYVVRIARSEGSLRELVEYFSLAEDEGNRELIGKLVDVLERDYDTYEIESSYFEEFDFISFKIRTKFSSNDLGFIFRYVNSSKSKIKEWQILPNSWNTLSISIFLKKNAYSREVP